MKQTPLVVFPEHINFRGFCSFSLQLFVHKSYISPQKCKFTAEKFQRRSYQDVIGNKRGNIKHNRW